jgi:hypothetical protein
MNPCGPTLRGLRNWFAQVQIACPTALTFDQVFAGPANLAAGSRNGGHVMDLRRDRARLIRPGLPIVWFRESGEAFRDVRALSPGVAGA